VIALARAQIPALTLLQHVGRTTYRGQALHYGRDIENRYDSPTGAYGVLYLGQDLPTALMESVFHKHQWLSDPKRQISLADIRQRMVRLVATRQHLLLFNINAPDVMAAQLGLNLEQLITRDYTHTRELSQRVHAMTDSMGVPQYDGILYPSRNNYPAHSIALFERAKDKVELIEDLDLVDHAEWPAFVTKYRIGILPDPAEVI